MAIFGGLECHSTGGLWTKEREGGREGSGGKEGGNEGESEGERERGGEGSREGRGERGMEKKRRGEVKESSKLEVGTRHSIHGYIHQCTFIATRCSHTIIFAQRGDARYESVIILCDLLYL